MTEDSGNVPIRTRTADEIAEEIVRMVNVGQDPVLLLEIVRKFLEGILDRYDEMDGAARRQIDNYMNWALSQ